MDERVRKLPKWAQDVIFSQERQIQGLKRTIRSLRRENQESLISYRATCQTEKVFIPEYSYVTFNVRTPFPIPGHESILDAIEFHHALDRDDAPLFVRATARNGVLLIQPRATNMVDISIGGIVI